MPNSMIQTVAATIYSCVAANGGVVRGGPENGWRDFMADAETIVRSMRSPTEEMTKAGATVHHGAGYPTSDVDALTVWEKMIDAALAETTEGIA